MSPARLSANPLSLNDTLEFSKVQLYALENLEKEILAAFGTNQSIRYPEFADMNKEVVLERFDFFRKEVEWTSMLVLLATIEAFLREDYTEKRRKTRRFRTLYTNFGSRTPLEDILNAWKEERPLERSLFGKYKDALRLRNWLAHGRYFSNNVGRHEYSVVYIYELGIKIQDILD